MTEICQNALRFAPWLEEKSRRLPGIMPLEMTGWLQWDEASEAQISEKTRLLSELGLKISRHAPEARPAMDELLKLVLTHGRSETLTKSEQNLKILDREGRAHATIPQDLGSGDPDHTLALLKFLDFDPFEFLCRIVPEDFCILQKQGDEHVLTAALLGFPASWTLAEKFLRPLTTIHDPVAPYTSDIARRVQRLFDAVRPDRPLWRANALRYGDPTLYQPRRYGENRDLPAEGGYIRSERQSILRLPETDAVVFSIHTTVIPESVLTPEQAAGLREFPIIHASEDA